MFPGCRCWWEIIGFLGICNNFLIILCENGNLWISFKTFLFYSNVDPPFSLLPVVIEKFYFLLNVKLKVVKSNLTAYLFLHLVGGRPWLSWRYSWWCSFWKLYLYGEPNERKLGEGSPKQIKSEKEKGGERGVHILLLLVEFRNFMNSQFELKLTLREG